MRTTPLPVLKCTADSPGSPSSTQSIWKSARATGSPSHSPTLARVAADLHPGDPRGVLAVGDRGRVQSPVALPLDEERQRRVVEQVEHPDLPPGQVDAVRPPAMAGDRRTSQPGLDRGQVVHGHDPREPATAGLAARLDRLPERRLVGSRVVERRDDLEVDAVREREQEVAGAEARVQPAVTKTRTECGAQPLRAGTETFGSGGVGEVVESHPSTFSPVARAAARRVRRQPAKAFAT